MDLTAIQAALLSDTPPVSEVTTAAAGSAMKTSRDNHAHPRLTSSTWHTTDATGQATVIFTRTFSVKPSVVCTAEEDNTNPVPRFKVRRWLKADGSAWTSGSPYGGCVVYADRSRALPVISPLSTGLTLILNLVNALNVIFATLSGYTAYEAAPNMPFSAIGLQASNV